VEFRAKFEVRTTKTISNSRCESLEIELFHRKLSSRTRANSLSEFHTNSLKYTATIEEVILTAIDYFECGERNTELCAITAPSYKQANKLSQLQKTQLNLLTVTFLAIFKGIELNFR